MSRFTSKFASASVEWPTPQDLFNELHAEFGFTLDVCATPENAKCGQFFTKEQDGLKQTWSGVCWLNPPYGRDVSKWLQKAVNEIGNGVTTVALIPARTNTDWWHDLCMERGKITFLRGRPKFGSATHGLPQPLAVVVFKPVDKVRHEHAVIAGAKGGRATSEAKRKASKENGTAGGRPRNGESKAPRSLRKQGNWF